ncbi:MAG: alanine racemase, partial [Clostridia bacterium]|nr:alanine racemase [Clostridia bacterium]
ALRRADIAAPVLVLGAADREDAEAAVRHDLTMTVCSAGMVRLCQTAAENVTDPSGRARQARVHLKVDSGMGRIGVRTEAERDAVLAALEACGAVRCTGAYTHFSDADGDADGERYSVEQFRRFLALTEGLKVPRHCANSAASLRHPEWALDMVREGISLYGYPPVPTGLDLRPCMAWRAKISYVKEVPAGACISYGRTYCTERPSRIATVTCGYGDGYHRAASGRAEVLIRGRRARVLGRICMDQMMADVTEIPEAVEGDPVTLMGTDGTETITAEDLARWSGTISYEVLLSCGSRVERVNRGDL